MPVDALADKSLNKQRMLQYKTFAVAFSYPDNNLFEFFPQFLPEKDNLQLEYDRFFRSSEVWLYGCEYSAENEFQRAQSLSDINGFYRAFGLETDKDRPDSLPCELEFMHYLILKELNAPNQDKVSICFDAQKKFFKEHLYPSAEKIAQKIISLTRDGFYCKAGKDLLKFLESEKNIFHNK